MSLLFTSGVVELTLFRYALLITYGVSGATCFGFQHVLAHRIFCRNLYKTLVTLKLLYAILKPCIHELTLFRYALLITCGVSGAT